MSSPLVEFRDHSLFMVAGDYFVKPEDYPMSKKYRFQISAKYLKRLYIQLWKTSLLLETQSCNFYQ